jgi:hypothetical protein
MNIEELEVKKQACIDYICGIEKEAFDFAPILQAGKTFVKSSMGKKMLASAGTGAVAGALSNKDNRAKGAITGGLIGGAMPFAAKKVESAMPTIKNTIKGVENAGVKNPAGTVLDANVLASEEIELVFMEKVAEEILSK